MSQLDALLVPIPDGGPRRCKLGKIIDGLEEPYRAALTGLVDTACVDGGLSDEGVRARMRAAGLAIGSSVIRRHRLRECTCQSGVKE